MIPQIIKDICDKINADSLDITKYSDKITSVGIIINCFPDDWINRGYGKPRKYVSYKNGYADIRLPIPYEAFQAASYQDKYNMVVQNIVESVSIIEGKCNKSKKAMFDGDSLVDYLLEKINLSV